MRRLTTILALLCLLPLVGAARPAVVVMKDLAFSPAVITVQAGTTVTWQNKDTRDYNVTAADGSFASGSIPPGGTFSHTFSAAGTFAYGSSLHPRMRATVVVK